MFDERAKTAFIVVSITLLLGAIGFDFAVKKLNLYLQKESVPLRDLLVNVPKQMGDWKASGPDVVLSETIIEELGTEHFLSRSYVREGTHGEVRIEAHVAYYTGMIDAIPHVPDRCFLAAGLRAQSIPDNFALHLDRSSWRLDRGAPNRATGEPYPLVTHRDPVTGRPDDVRLPVGDYSVRMIEFSHDDRPGMKIFGGYFFVANGRITPRPEDVKLLAFQVSEKYAYYCKVQLTMYTQANVDAETYVTECADLLDELLPEVMRCLPDWSEVEARDTNAASSPESE